MIADNDKGRAKRLADALRANLRRRKASTPDPAGNPEPDGADPNADPTRPKGAKVGG